MSARVIAVANQKGGVAKTTTVASLGVALAELGRRVLLVDLDPQACLTFSLGLDPEALDLTVHDVLLGRVNTTMAIVATAQADNGGPDLLPAKIDLVGVETSLQSKTGREYRLQAALEEVAEGYDDILLDCPPSLGLLTVNGLTAAHEVLVPLQCEALAHRGVGQLLDTVHDVQRFTNRALTVRGVLPTMFDARTSHANAVLDDVSTRYSLEVLAPPIAKSVRFAEAPGSGRSVLLTSRRTPGAEAYRDHARQIAARHKAGRAPLSKKPAVTPSPAPVATTARKPARAKVAAKAAVVTSNFDRVRPRTPNAPRANASRPMTRVSDGRQSLFSEGDRDGGVGAVRIECSRCGVTSAVSPLHAVRLATPSIHDPILHRGHPSFVLCPACRKRSWVKLSLWHR